MSTNKTNSTAKPTTTQGRSWSAVAGQGSTPAAAATPKPVATAAPVPTPAPTSVPVATTTTTNHIQQNTNPLQQLHGVFSGLYICLSICFDKFKHVVIHNRYFT